jgi:hypothetical protein
VIRHLVLFKLNEGVDREDPRVLEGARAFEALGDQVPQVRFWETGWNVAERPDAYDFAINAAFDDHAGLKGYLEHPDHQAGVARWQELATWVIADYGI